MKTISKKSMLFLALLGLMLSVTLAGCGQQAAAPKAGTQATSPAASSGSAPATNAVAGKKIFIIDSYNEGYDWSDREIVGVKGVLDNSGAETKIYHMDTKRNSAEKAKIASGLTAKQMIDEYKPDVIIGFDDNAIAYVMKPYFLDSTIPFIHGGVNWEVASYGLGSNNTGMLEISDVQAIVTALKTVAKGTRIGYLAPDNESSRKEVINAAKSLGVTFVERYVKTADEWKAAYTELQTASDMLIIHNPSYTGWVLSDIKQFVLANTKIPTGGAYDIAIPIQMITYGKLPEEFGKWTGETALKVLSGTNVSAIPQTQNKEVGIFFNQKLAEAAGFTFPASFVSTAKIME